MLAQVRGTMDITIPHVGEALHDEPASTSTEGVSLCPGHRQTPPPACCKTIDTIVS
jgi:hypothetical protein